MTGATEARDFPQSPQSASETAAGRVGLGLPAGLGLGLGLGCLGQPEQAKQPSTNTSQRARVIPLLWQRLEELANLPFAGVRRGRRLVFLQREPPP